MNIKEYLGLNSLFEDTAGNKMSHDEMYTKIVNAIGLSKLTPLLPTDKQALQIAYEEDENFNNIPLREWDVRHPYVKSLLKGIGITQSSLSQSVCILKQAARIYITQ